MLDEIGKKAFGFIVAYSIISTIMVASFVASQIPPPDPLTAIPVDTKQWEDWGNQLRQAKEQWGDLWWLPALFVSIGLILLNLVGAFAIGFPTLFYKLASMTNNPGIVTGLTILGVVLQICALVYGFRLLRGWGRG